MKYITEFEAKNLAHCLQIIEDTLRNISYRDSAYGIQATSDKIEQLILCQNGIIIALDKFGYNVDLETYHITGRKD